MSIRQSFVCENCKHEFGCIETFQTKTKGKVWLCRVCEFENSNCNSQTLLENKAKEQPKSITAEAEEIINGERRSAYGPIEESAKNLAKLWSAILGPKLKEDLTPSDTMLLMAGLKILREANAHKRDNLVDVIGYVLLTQKLEEGK
jgi:hypothetical protein